MADLYDKAVQRRDKLRAFVKKMEKRIAAVMIELNDLEAYCRVHEKLGDSDEKTPTAAKSKLVILKNKKKPEYGEKVKRMREYSRQLISKHGAMTSRDVLLKLDEMGIGHDLLPGDDMRKRLSYMSSVMSRDTQLQQDREAGGYVLKEKQPA
jgi:hypothetical protein